MEHCRSGPRRLPARDIAAVLATSVAISLALIGCGSDGVTERSAPANSDSAQTPHRAALSAPWPARRRVPPWPPTPSDWRRPRSPSRLRALACPGTPCPATASPTRPTRSAQPNRALRRCRRSLRRTPPRRPPQHLRPPRFQRPRGAPPRTRQQATPLRAPPPLGPVFPPRTPPLGRALRVRPAPIAPPPPRTQPPRPRPPRPRPPRP